MSSMRLFIGNINNQVRERDVERFFKGYGKIREIILKSGFGFVEFEDERDAEDAVHDLNGKDLCGQRCAVEVSRPKGGDRGGGGRYGGGGGDRYGGGGGRFGGGGGMRSNNAPHSTQYKVVVENVSSRVGWQDLKDFMNKAGRVTFADAHRNRDNEGIVCFESHSEMKKAIDKLDGTELFGRKIKMISEYRGSSRSRSRSRSPRRTGGARKSPSRSRSKSRSGSRSPSRERRRSDSRSE